MPAPADDGQLRLVHLIYRSRSLLGRGAAEPMAVLLELVTGARARNTRNGITGILLFDGCMFLQVLEGPLAAVEQTYERIVCDQRHAEIELVDLAPVEKRDYTGWTMAMLDASRDRFPRLMPFMSRGGEARAAELRQVLVEALAHAHPETCAALAPA
jgi:hypothetical protein